MGWLTDASRVHVVGVRKCFSVAYLFGYLLRLVRREVHQLGTAPGGLVEELRDLAEGDVLVGISVHRYTATPWPRLPWRPSAACGSWYSPTTRRPRWPGTPTRVSTWNAVA